MIRFDFSQLIAGIRIEKEDVEKHVEAVASKVAADLLTGLVLATPVDTGEARNGWHLDGTGTNSTIENRVPYIGRLNDGWSDQAPAGFIEQVIDDVARGA